MYITTYTPPFPSYAWMDKYSSSIVPHHISWPTLISLKYFERGRRFQDRGWGVCLVRVGVGAGSQKGWDGLDGGGEITNFAERETELLWKCLGKQVRASFHLLPALCPTLLSPLLWKADHRERRRGNVLKIQSHPWAKLWYEVAPSRLNFTARCCIFTIPSSFSAGQRIADTVVKSRRLCCLFLFGGTIGFNQSSVLSEGTVGLQSSNQGLCASPLSISQLLTSPLSTTMC